MGQWNNAINELLNAAEKGDEYRIILGAVAAMRRCQKRYFADRKQGDLVESKRLEKLVDAKLEEVGIKI